MNHQTSTVYEQNGQITEIPKGVTVNIKTNNRYYKTINKRTYQQLRNRRKFLYKMINYEIDQRNTRDTQKTEFSQRASSGGLFLSIKY